MLACTAEMPNRATSVAVSKPRPNRKPIGKHVPASGDEAEERTEEAGEEATTVEQDVEIVLDERVAVLHRLKRAVDRHQDNDVEDRDGEQEQRRDTGADDSAHLLERIEARGKRRRGECDADRHEHHDRRVAERKEKADANRTLALLHELAGDVVDRRDMVGVDCVAQAERIGQQRRAEEDRPRFKDDERPEPDDNITSDQDAVDGQQTAAQIWAAFSQDF